MGLVLWAVPLLAVFALAVTNNKKLFHLISVFASGSAAAIGIFLTRSVILMGQVEYAPFGGAFYLDAVSIIILDLVLLIGLLVSIYAIGYLEEELKHKKIDPGRMKLFYILMYLFMFTMILTLTVKNMGIMWVSIEGTTLASAFLVGFNNDKRALEAAWKYVIICSVGIAVAFLGIILLHLSSVGVFQQFQALDWPALMEAGQDLDSSVLRLAFIFILVGFGTKAGLAPMHTWLPDAHSQAPSPVSALLSGVLLNSAMYGVIRTWAIVNKNLGSGDFTGRLLIAAGVISIATAGVFILTQRDYKRLLAYSSIEHMGIIALALGLATPLAIYGAFFHMINHSLTKSMLFLASGNILQKYGSKEIARVKFLLTTLPVTGLVFLLGIFAIGGAPPFSVFASEFTIMIAIFEKQNTLLGVALILLLAFVFAGIARSLLQIFYGKGSGGGIAPGENYLTGTAVIVILLAVISISGLYLPEGLKGLIICAQRILIGG